MKPLKIIQNNGLNLLIMALPLVALLLFWDKFPARVAIHWGIDGKPNGWASREIGLILIPIINAILYVLFSFLDSFDSLARSNSPEARASLARVMQTIRRLNTIFFTLIAFIVEAVALGWNPDMNRVMTLLLLILFGLLGNLLPKLHPNRFVGIRTQWTLKSPEVWRRTNRLFGFVMVIGSVILLLPCMFLPSIIAIVLFMTFVIGMAISAMIYSRHCYLSLQS